MDGALGAKGFSLEIKKSRVRPVDRPLNKVGVAITLLETEFFRSIGFDPLLRSGTVHLLQKLTD